MKIIDYIYMYSTYGVNESGVGDTAQRAHRAVIIMSGATTAIISSTTFMILSLILDINVIGPVVFIVIVAIVAVAVYQTLNKLFIKSNKYEILYKKRLLLENGRFIFLIMYFSCFISFVIISYISGKFTPFL